MRPRSLRRQLATLSALAPPDAERIGDPRQVIGLALGGALAGDADVVAYVADHEMASGASALLELGIWNELRSAAVIVESQSGTPRGEDSRALLCSAAKIPVFEAAGPNEAAWLVQVAFDVSRQLHIPVVLRDASGQVLRHDFTTSTGTASWSRIATPLCSASHALDYHRRKRERLLEQLTHVAETCSLPLGADGPGGVILAGHLGAAVQARVASRRIGSLRLGLAWPLPIETLGKFLAARSDVLVLEEGGTFLLDQINLLAQREGLRCRVRGCELATPRRIDADLAEEILTMFAGAPQNQVTLPQRDATARQSVDASVAMMTEDTGEPWPLYLARMRQSLTGDVDPTQSLLRALRELPRPAVIVAEDRAANDRALRERWVDVRVPAGLASCVAASLSGIGSITDQPSTVGAPITVALIAAQSSLAAELPAIANNASAKREVLHVLLVERKAGAQPDDKSELQLRAAGVQVASASLDEGNPAPAVAYAASRTGPRALVCYYEAKAG